MLLLIPGPVTTRARGEGGDGAGLRALGQRLPPALRRRARAGARHRRRRRPGPTPRIALQGCGHFVIEAAVRSFLPPGGRILVPADRRLCRTHGPAGARGRPRGGAAAGRRRRHPVAPRRRRRGARRRSGDFPCRPGLQRDRFRRGARRRGDRRAWRGPPGGACSLDAVSAFGALPLDLAAQPEIDAVVFTSNKCLEGMPGLAFAVARIDRLTPCAGHAGSWSLDLADIHAPYAAHRRRQLPLHPAGAGAGRVRGGARPLRRRGRPAGPAGALPRQNARVLHDGMLRIGLMPCLPRRGAGAGGDERARAGRSRLDPARLRRRC